jgi:ATP-binding cassette subfamily B multidrug efflux pump
VIEHFNLTIKSGEKIGIVGRSGAGKSTLIQLLLHFYEINQGRILIDGQNIHDVTQDSLRANIALVTQDTSLLHRTVAENIKYGRPNATEVELQLAIKKARAEEFIPQLTDQKDVLVSMLMSVSEESSFLVDNVNVLQFLVFFLKTHQSSF